MLFYHYYHIHNFILYSKSYNIILCHICYAFSPIFYWYKTWNTLNSSCRSILYKFSYLSTVNIFWLLLCEALHWNFKKITLYLLSHNWFMFSILCLRLSTSITFSIDEEVFIPFFSMRIILLFWFLLNVSVSPSSFFRSWNIDLSSVIWCKHPLSRYCDYGFLSIIKHIYKSNDFVFRYLSGSYLVSFYASIFFFF